MAIQITRIDDKSDGFTVDFTVINTYRRTFPAREAGKDQNVYARESVASIVQGPVEKPEGVIVVPKPVTATEANTVIDLDTQPASEPVPEPTVEPVP